MSYDLYFWRETSIHSESPDEIYSRLSLDEDLPGIAQLNIARIKERFAESFPGIDDAGGQLDWEGEDSFFQVSWSICSKPGYTAAISVNCGYELLKRPETINRIMAVLQEFGCALYDPQTGQRYEQPAPTIT